MDENIFAKMKRADNRCPQERKMSVRLIATDKNVTFADD